MPQMAPMMWLILFCVFLMSLFCFVTTNYFLLPHQKKSLLLPNTPTSQKNWKW